MKVLIVKYDGNHIDSKGVLGCYSSWTQAEKWLVKTARNLGPNEKMSIGWDTIGFDDGTIIGIEEEDWL